MHIVPSRAPFIGGAVAAGLVSWAIVHRRPVRGDQAVLLLALALAVQYVCCVASSSEQLSHHALRATLVLYLAYLSSLFAALLFYRLSPWHPLASYPGPFLARVTSLWLTHSSLWGKRYKVIDELHNRYGAFVRIGPNILSISSPSVIPLYGIMEKSKTYQRHIRAEGFELFFKPDSTAQHRERKRLWANLFTTTGLSQLMPNLERRTVELLQCMERRQSATGFVDIKEVFSHWAFDVTADVIFGGCTQFELMKKGDPLGLSMTGKIAFAVLDTFGPSSWIMEILCHVPRQERANAMLTAMTEALRNRLNSTPSFPDLASFLLVGDVPKDDILWDTCIAIIGGSDNLVVMLTLAVFFLLAKPKYYQRLRKELDEAFPDRSGSLPPAELAALPFLNGVLAEVLRLGTPFFLPRVVPSAGVVVDGRYIPGGTVVAYAAYTQQLHPDNFFPEPREFHPDRWVPHGLGPQTKADKSVLASFTFGPYACIGKPLAYREMRHALARLVLAFDMTLPPGFDCRKWREGMINMHTTFFKHKLPVRVSRRPGVQLESHFALFQ